EGMNPSTGLSPSIEADAEHLLLSSDLSKEQFGMAVEQAQASDSDVTVRTTGANFVFEPGSGSGKLSQRLGRRRQAGTIAFPPACLTDLKVEGSASGAVSLSAGQDRLKLRINGDSLLMLQSSEPLTLTCSVAFRPEIIRQFRGNVMFLDEYGVFAAYPAT